MQALLLLALLVQAAPLPLRLRVNPAAGVGAVPMLRAVPANLPALGGQIKPVLSMSGDFGGVFDGSGYRPEGAEEFEHVLRNEKKREEVQHARAERPVLDYVRARFSPDQAKEFLAELYDGVSGHDLVEPLVTRHAAHLDVPLDPSRVDMTQFGRTEAELREIASAKGIGAQPYHRFLDQAFRQGIIYRLHDSIASKTYYGVPYEVRAALGLKTPVEQPKAETAAAPVKNTAELKQKLADFMAELPEREELVEFTADAQAALESGEGLKDALLTLVDSAEGTEWEKGAQALWDAAEAGGLL